MDLHLRNIYVNIYVNIYENEEGKQREEKRGNKLNDASNIKGVLVYREKKRGVEKKGRVEKRKSI